MSVKEAAEYLGISAKTLYKWKAKAASNGGYLMLNGCAVEFRYRQTGAMGKGKIIIEKAWLDELLRAMQGKTVARPKSARAKKYKHIQA